MGAERKTLRRPNFRTTTRRSINFVMALQQPSSSAVMQLPHLSGHLSLGTVYDLCLMITNTRVQRAQRKQIGWRPQQVDKYDENIHKRLWHCATLGPSAIATEILAATARTPSALLAQAATGGRERHKGIPAPQVATCSRDPSRTRGHRAGDVEGLSDCTADLHETWVDAGHDGSHYSYPVRTILGRSMLANRGCTTY